MASLVNRAAVREIADLYLARSDSRLDLRVAELRQEMAVMRADLLKWMFLFWAGTVIPLAGLILAIGRR